MVDFHVKKTLNTPEVHLNFRDGTFRMEGRSIPEDPGELYQKIIQNLNKYFQKPQPVTRLEFKLEYINSGSSKLLLEIFRLIKSQFDKKINCSVIWYYEQDDESIHDLGLHFKNSLKLPVELVEYL